jgi:alkylhydroperoxidase/carboxymuconolactone decarboxylase family protein YurZ
MSWLRKLAGANRAQAKRQRAWVDVEQELRSAIQAGVAPEEIAEAIGPVLRRRGLDSMVERIIAAARRASG